MWKKVNIHKVEKMMTERWPDGSFDYLHDLPSETDLENVYYHIAWSCEHLRQNFLETKDPEFEDQLLRLLPNSYKVVKL